MLGPFATASRRTPPNFTLPFIRCRYQLSHAVAHRCPQQRQRVTQNGPNEIRNCPTLRSRTDWLCYCSAAEQANELQRLPAGQRTAQFVPCLGAGGWLCSVDRQSQTTVKLTIEYSIQRLCAGISLLELEYRRQRCQSEKNSVSVSVCLRHCIGQLNVSILNAGFVME